MLVIFIAYNIYIFFFGKIIYSLTKEPLKKSSEENGEISIHLDGKLQNLISGKSMPPFQKQLFADVLQSRCS